MPAATLRRNAALPTRVPRAGPILLLLKLFLFAWHEPSFPASNLKIGTQNAYPLRSALAYAGLLVFSAAQSAEPRPQPGGER